MTVFRLKRRPYETLGLSLQLALCSQCGAQFFTVSHAVTHNYSTTVHNFSSRQVFISNIVNFQKFLVLYYSNLILRKTLRHYPTRGIFIYS